LNKHPLTAAIQAELGWLRVQNTRERGRKALEAAMAYRDALIAEPERRTNVWWRRLLRWLGVRRGR
jgi:hypothetical protein